MNNTYGIVRPSTLDIDKDVEIWYNYRTDRTANDTSDSNFIKVDDVVSMLSCSETSINGVNKTLNGMFNLSLPVSIFGKTGIYTFNNFSLFYSYFSLIIFGIVVNNVYFCSYEQITNRFI